MHFPQERPDLLEPSLQGLEERRSRARPWRLGSQFWVAFFGGAVAVAAFAWMNARRLDAPSRVGGLIVAAGVVGFAVATVVGAIFTDGVDTAFQITYRVVGVLTFLVLHRLQQSPDRIYRMRTPGEEQDRYEGAFGPGLAAVIVGAIIQITPVVVIAG